MYSLREGIIGLRRAKFATFTATSAMAVALVLIGVFTLLSYEAQRVSSWLRLRVGEFDVFLVEDVDDNRGRMLHRRAATMPGVAEALYISREEAQQIFESEFGEGAQIYADEPFLPPSIKVRVRSNYAHPDSLEAMVSTIQAWTDVDDIVYEQRLLVLVEENLNLLTLLGFGLGGLVVFAAIFLVANTIRLTIYARRLLIRTMKLVGATNGFIRRPFIVEGILQGFMAALIASGMLWGLYQLLIRYLPSAEVADPRLPILWLGLVLVSGLLLGFLGSFFAVRRFIKKVALH